MHERTERAIARLLFVFCCALPTAATLLMILVTWTPWYHRKQLRGLASQLSRESGLVVQVGDFHNISPRKSTLKKVRLIEPETGQEVVRVREVTWSSESDRTNVVLHQPELQSSQLSHAWYLIHDRFLCRPEKTSEPLSLTAHDLTIQSDGGSLSLRELSAAVNTQREVTEIQIQCLPVTREHRSPIKISIRRDRAGKAPKTQWTLQTGQQPLPCSALAEWLPLMRSFGDDAAFTGMIAWEVDHRGHWMIDLGGSRFTGLDLGRLCEDLPHRLSAHAAELHLERCYIDPGNSVNVSGSFVARKGWVGQSLLKVLNEQLDVQVDLRAMDPQLGDVPYEILGIHFRISDAAMKLDGICGNQRGFEQLPPGVVMCTQQSAIAATNDRVLPSVRLMRVMSPVHGELVPIASETRSFMDVLIAPSRIMPVSGIEEPTSRIRTATSWSGGEPIQQR